MTVKRISQLILNSGTVESCRISARHITTLRVSPTALIQTAYSLRRKKRIHSQTICTSSSTPVTTRRLNISERIRRTTWRQVHLCRLIKTSIR